MEHTNENCIFCKIIAGQIPANKIYEDEDTFAMLDINPVNPGHTLVISKEHYVNIFEVPDALITKMISTVKKVAHAIKDSMSIENGNIIMNNGKDAGQTVFHAHIHFIPRNAGDGHKDLWHGKPYGEGEAQEIIEKIKKAL